jgi:PAS domain S-box-containing protein
MSLDDDLRLAFDLAPVGLCVTRERVIQRTNAAFAAMFGYAGVELEGRSLLCLYPSQAEFENVAAAGSPLMQRTGTYSDERIMRHRSGRLFWVHISGQSLRRDVPLACAVWMFEDISTRRQVRVDMTTREREVARQLAEGRSTKQIARTLDLSPRTIEGHRARIMKKVGAGNAGELVARLIG